MRSLIPVLLSVLLGVGNIAIRRTSNNLDESQRSTDDRVITQQQESFEFAASGGAGVHEARAGWRTRIIDVASSYTGLQELTGNNDGPKIDEWNALAGAPKGSYWCAAFIYGVSYESIGPTTPYPRTAWSPAMVAGGKKLEKGTLGQPADVVGFWFSSKKRVAHVGIVEQWGTSTVTTIEGNTSGDSGVDRNGGGVYRKKRLKGTIYCVKDWIQ